MVADARAVSRSKRDVDENSWPREALRPVYKAIAKIRFVNGYCMELAWLGITKFYNQVLCALLPPRSNQVLL